MNYEATDHLEILESFLFGVVIYEAKRSRLTHSSSTSDWANMWHTTCRMIADKLGNFPDGYFPAPEEQKEDYYCSPAHVVQPFHKQSMEMAFATFRNELETVINSQFRKEKMYLTPVMYHFHSLWDKSAVPIWVEDNLAVFRRSSKPIFEKLKDQILKNGKLSYSFLCLNDTSPDPNHDTWVKDVENLLETLFPEPSKYEK